MADSPFKKIILATDLSMRCDRALDRAVHFSKTCGAELYVAHAFETDPASGFRSTPWHYPADARVAVAARIAADLHGEGADARIITGEGPAHVFVSDQARKAGADLIVTGTARAEPFGRFVLGSTVEKILGEGTTPLLVVKNRTHGPYKTIAVATDLTPASVRAVRAAAAFAAQAAPALVHAYGMPYVGFSADPAAARAAGKPQAEAACRRFLDAAGLPEALHARFAMVVEHGPPLGVLHDYVARSATELMILGHSGRKGVARALLGSVASGALQELPCDVLIVPPGI